MKNFKPVLCTLAVAFAVSAAAIEIAPLQGICDSNNSVSIRLTPRMEIARLSARLTEPAASNSCRVAFGKDSDGDGKLDAEETGIVLKRGLHGWSVLNLGNISMQNLPEGGTLQEFGISPYNERTWLNIKHGVRNYIFPYNAGWISCEIAASGSSEGVFRIDFDFTRFFIRIARK